MKKEHRKKQDQVRYTRLQMKFLLGLATILLFFFAITSSTLYYFQKKSLEQDAYYKSELVMTAMAANRSYVREVLRPKMYSLLGDNQFILEAMSSSYMSRKVMERFNENFSNVIYRRAAINARNPDYEASSREVEMINYFDENPVIDEWKGFVEKDGHRYFMRYKPVYAEKSCSHCHGSPSEAPEQIVTLYGDRRGFYREVGNVYGVMSVGLPVDPDFKKIKDIALTVFIGVFPAILFLYAVISLFFNRIISQNLNNLLNIFRENLGDGEKTYRHKPAEVVDEISELTESARAMALDLQHNRKQLETYANKILQSRELLQSVFDGITDPVVLINRTLQIKNVNRAFLNRYKLHLDEVVDTSIKQLPAGSCCPLLECLDVLENIPIQPVTREKALKTGEIFVINFYPIRHHNGEVESLVCYVRDVTEQKLLELKIQQTEKLVSMGQLAAGVAHEINNPLGIILCHTELIKDEKNLSEEARADLEIIEKHAENCKNIVADMLNFARQHKAIKELASINSIVKEVVQFSANQFLQQNITVDLQLDPQIPLISLDVEKIKQVLFNLLLNGTQAIGENGYILCSTSYLEKTNEAQIIVEDNGCGIDPEKIEKIFDPFFTTKEPGQGTGLGLSLSYGIINEHNGDIRGENVEGGGSRFTITLNLDGDQL
ncbi:MAG: hypothetical protein CSA26_02965 [Desulfobacterales bacterium]|nr:MAG: hypothetical protein CSA26_02965 [Desulfobacterales bacterium]